MTDPHPSRKAGFADVELALAGKYFALEQSPGRYNLYVVHNPDQLWCEIHVHVGGKRHNKPELTKHFSWSGWYRVTRDEGASLIAIRDLIGGEATHARLLEILVTPVTNGESR